jgi:hypothetical protein
MQRIWSKAGAGIVFLAATLLPASGMAAQAGADATTGWVCGLVVDEGSSFIAGAQLQLYRQGEAGLEEAAPVAELASDQHGQFCLRDLAPGFYELQVVHAPFPMQPTRAAEVRAGLVNRLTPPLELQLEPGDPSVSVKESFDGMALGEARATLERLLRGDSTSLQELARRLLPKRGVVLPHNINRLVVGLDVKPLVDELLHQLDNRSLPPLKTARFVYLIGELSDPRNRSVVVPELLRRLRDARPLPSVRSPSDGEGAQTTYVSDIAITALARHSGKDFKWKYGQPPFQNRGPVNAARDWWRSELQKEAEKQSR